MIILWGLLDKGVHISDFRCTKRHDIKTFCDQFVFRLKPSNVAYKHASLVPRDNDVRDHKIFVGKCANAGIQLYVACTP